LRSCISAFHRRRRQQKDHDRYQPNRPSRRVHGFSPAGYSAQFKRASNARRRT
jgi:hypothetical protein